MLVTRHLPEIVVFADMSTAYGEHPVFHVDVEREEKWWMIYVTINGQQHITEARRLKNVFHMARDLIATVTDLPYDAFDIELTFKDRGKSG